MGEFKGTPGEWFASGTEVVSMPLQIKISNNISGNSYEEAQANAQLVAAAPDMLSALQELVHLHMCEQEGISSGQPSPTDWLDAVDKASAAIEKATRTK